MRAPDHAHSPSPWRQGLSVLGIQLSERRARFGLMLASAFNALGLLLELFVIRDQPGIDRGPSYLSIAFGALAFLFAARTEVSRQRRPRPALRLLFVANAAFVCWALYAVEAYSGEGPRLGFPFQANKLGALVVAMLAPDFVIGLTAISLHCGSSIWQYFHFPAQVRARTSEEPWALLAFAMAAVLALVYRLQTGRLEQKLFEAEAKRRLAETFLELRDLMNTPLQSMALAIDLLKQSSRSAIEAETWRQLQESWNQLHRLNHRLKVYESTLSWNTRRGGLPES